MEIALMLIASLVSTAYGAYTSSQEAKQAQLNQEAMAEQELINSERAAQEKENQAEQERLNRGAAAKEESAAAKRRRAAIESGYAKSGVLLDGSPADFLTEQAGTDELNIQRGNQRSEAKAKGFEISGEGIRREGQFTSTMMRKKADAYGKKAKTSLIAGGLKMASSAGSSYYSWMDQKGPKKKGGEG